MNVKQKPCKKIRKGDTVIAIAGNNIGQTGNVLAIDGDKVIVQGLNIRKKAVKKSQAKPEGGFLEIEKAIHVSNLKVCIDGKPVKLKVKNDQGTRSLYYMNEGKEVTYRKIKIS